jgi:hypothetical protein
MAEITGTTTVEAQIPAQTVPVLAPVQVSGVQSQRYDPSRPAVTTFQEDLTTAGQRRINLIWEYTQAIIAIGVVFTTMVCGVYGMVHTDTQVPTIISVAFGAITGFYFSRTNHAAIGGIGPKPEGQYLGR